MLHDGPDIVGILGQSGIAEVPFVAVGFPGIGIVDNSASNDDPVTSCNLGQQAGIISLAAAKDDICVETTSR